MAGGPFLLSKEAAPKIVPWEDQHELANNILKLDLQGDVPGMDQIFDDLPPEKLKDRITPHV